MELILRIDINIIAFIMLSLVCVLSYHQLEKQDALNRIYLRVSLVIVHMLVIETATCIINRHPGLWLIQITEILHILLFVLSPIATSYFYFLIRRLIFPSEDIFRKRRLLFVLPLIINTVITVLSPFFGFVFYIDSANVYHRGSLFFITAAITYFYILHGFISVIVFRKKLTRQEWSFLLFFIGFPIAGALIQVFVYGLLLIWSCSAFSLVLAYVFLQQRMVHLDDLTGAWDRRSFDHYISEKLQQNRGTFGIIYVDIDCLKEINDTYGHMEGDYAIKTAVSIIRNEIRKNDNIVRLGGDEFLVVLNVDNKDDLDTTIERIETAFLLYNKNSKKDYRLECSFGADVFDTSYSSIEQFINHVDNLMYKNKNIKKAAAR